jgi:peptidoglycan hydrolase CwlO-like protein
VAGAETGIVSGKSVSWRWIGITSVGALLTISVVAFSLCYSKAECAEKAGQENKANIAVIKSEMGTVKADVKELKNDVREIKHEQTEQRILMEKILVEVKK